MTSYFPPRAADDPDPKRIEADARRLMVLHQAIEPRGYDSEKRRAVLRHQIDALLDAWLLVTSFAVDELASSRTSEGIT